MTASLRPFTPGDLPAARALWSSCEGLGAGHDDDGSWHAFLLRNPGLSFVAEEDGRLVGTVLAGHDGRRGIVYRLAVAPDRRRDGLGGRLLESALDALRAEGLTRVLLFLFADNEAGRPFWRAVGARHHPELELHSLDLGGARADGR